MDTIANMLTMIRNAQAVKLPTVYVPFSKMRFEIARVLKENDFIGNFEKRGRKSKKVIEITLKYNSDNQPAISKIQRISRLSQRIYVKKEDIRPVRQGFGISIISTSKGIMTNREAKKKNLGGEVIFEVW